MARVTVRGVPKGSHPEGEQTKMDILLQLLEKFGGVLFGVPEQAVEKEINSLKGKTRRSQGRVDFNQKML